MDKMRFSPLQWFLALSAAAFLVFPNQPSQPQSVPVPTEKQLSRFLPDPVALSVLPSGEPKFFGSDLYKYIDGAADGYLEYGFSALLHQEYESSRTEITLDIYDFGSPENAFGIYARESSPEYQYLHVGAEGYGTSDILNFVQGKFYAKLSAFSNTEQTAPVLERMALAISRRMGPSAQRPGFLSLFPPQNLVDHSIRYIKRAPLGHDFLAPAVTASYAIGKSPTTLLITKALDSRAALGKLESIRSYFADSGTSVPADGLVPGAFRGSNRIEGQGLFFASNSFVILCINPPSDSLGFLKSVMGRIADKGDALSF